MIMPIDGDILMHFGPATADNEAPVEDIEIFHIPRGTLVCMRPGVWHQAAFPYMCESVNILVALAERVYANDCHLFEIPIEKQIMIVLDNA